MKKENRNKENKLEQLCPFDEACPVDSGVYVVGRDGPDDSHLWNVTDTNGNIARGVAIDDTKCEICRKHYTCKIYQKLVKPKKD